MTMRKPINLHHITAGSLPLSKAGATHDDVEDRDCPTHGNHGLNPSKDLIRTTTRNEGERLKSKEKDINKKHYNLLNIKI